MLLPLEVPQGSIILLLVQAQTPGNHFVYCFSFTVHSQAVTRTYCFAHLVSPEFDLLSPCLLPPPWLRLSLYLHLQVASSLVSLPPFCMSSDPFSTQLALDLNNYLKTVWFPVNFSLKTWHGVIWPLLIFLASSLDISLCLFSLTLGTVHPKLLSVPRIYQVPCGSNHFHKLPSFPGILFPSSLVPAASTLLLGCLA